MERVPSCLSPNDSASVLSPIDPGDVKTQNPWRSFQRIGLGLALCRMIVERHDGQLTALPDGKCGASFKFVLPITPVVGDTAAAEIGN